MSTFALVTGVIFRPPLQKTAKTGKLFTSCTIKVAAADNASSDFWSVLAFGDTAGAELMRLGINERVTIQGSLKLELYTANDGATKISRTVFADHVLALRAPPKERKAKAAAPTSQEQSTTTDPDLNDDLPF
jgi:single-stranded DNA-binding protein